MADLVKHLIGCGLFRPGERVICAVSGGADSMALLWAMWLSREALDIQISAAHYNHRLRGAESDRDEAFVRDFCREHGIDCAFGSGDVAAFAVHEGMSIEQAARSLRYRFLESLDCEKIVTAHHADDNAETILLNLIHGTGLRGLCGIPPVRNRLVRPLLSFTRAELAQFLKEQHIPHVEDSSNREDASQRNRIRHELLPLLLQENPDWLHTVQSMISQLRADEETLSTQTQLMLDAGRVEGGFSAAVLASLPDGHRRRVLRQILTEQAVQRPGHRHVELLERLVFADSPSAVVYLPGGLIARRSYDRISFDAPEAQVWTPVVIERNAITRIPQLGLEISCFSATEETQSRSVFTVIPAGQIIARPRRTGDRIHRSGGSKALKKLMIDRKIPRSERDLLPVLEDEQGILAVFRFGADRLRTGLDGAFTIIIKKMEDD